MYKSLHCPGFQFSSVQSFSRVTLFATPLTAACQASLTITNSQSLPKLMSTESLKPSNHLILCRPLLLLPSIFPNIKVFSNESALRIRWPKYSSFSFDLSHREVQEYWSGTYAFSRVTSLPRNWTGVSCNASGFFTTWAIREAPSKPYLFTKWEF